VSRTAERVRSVGKGHDTTTREEAAHAVRPGARTGRRSGAERVTPLIYQRHGDDLLVIASNGGAAPPGWFHNLQADPAVSVQVKADHHTARARVATAEEKPELWRSMTATGTPYDDFQAKADHEIPVVVLEPVSV
jgi:deazaflavin-dependent oxidoreductase (nitroreductase family)